MNTSIEIFRTGSHTATSGKVLSVSGDDLASVAASYDPAKHEAPIVIGHPSAAAPAYGWVAGLRVEGDRLVADAAQMDGDFAEAVRDGRYKKVSASFYLPDAAGNPTPGKLYLRHVGFLGAQPPAVKGLRQVSFSEAEAGTLEFADWAEKATGRLFRQLREWLIGKFGQEEADRALAGWDVDAVQESAAQPDRPVNFSETEAVEQARRAELDAREAAVAALEAQWQARQQAQEAQARAAENGAWLDRMIDQGRVLPAERERLAQFMETLDGAGTVDFAEGGTEPAASVFRAFTEALPARVPMGEVATGATVDFADENSITVAAELMIKAAAERGETLTFAQAVTRLPKGG